MRSKWLAGFLIVCMLIGSFPSQAFADSREMELFMQNRNSQSTEMDESGEILFQSEYGQLEKPGVHQHAENCYRIVENCIHKHKAKCYPKKEESNKSTSSNAKKASSSNAEAYEPTECKHVCNEKNGCIAKILDCPYQEEIEYEAEECICTELCTKKLSNEKCPVCAEDISLCNAVCSVGDFVAENNGIKYSSLKEAVENATPGDAIELLADTELSESVIIDKNIGLDMNEKTIKVQISKPSKEENALGEEKTASAFIVTAGKEFSVKNGAIRGSGETVDNRAIKGKSENNISLSNVTIADFHAATGNGGAVCINEGDLTITDSHLGFYDFNTDEYGGNSARNGGAVWGKDTSVIITGSDLFYNKSKDPEGLPNQAWFGGGALYLEGGSKRRSKVRLENNYFFSNETKDHGGAIHLDTIESADIIGNRIESNIAYNHFVTDSSGKTKSRGGDGAGIYVRLVRDYVNIKDNEITDGTAIGWGGGIRIMTTEGKTFLDGNIVTENKAERGGGISLGTIGRSKIELRTGEICNNKATEFGGGIDYTTHTMPALRLQNVLITDNTAVRGGGIWSCPASTTEMHSTLGGAIFGNTAKGTYGSFPPYNITAAGDEVRYEGIDSEDRLITDANPPSLGTKMTVTKRALGGGLMEWYQDATEIRYQPGVPEADPKVYTNTNLSFGLHGELSEEHQKLAEAEAKLIVKGNISKGRGGGIATNSPIVIGIENADVSVKVEKQWTEEKHPKEILVDLYRVGPDGSDRVKLDSNVPLNEINGWKTEFCNLPSQYIDDKGNIQNCTYEVVEQAVEGWSCKADVEFKDNTYMIKLTNSPKKTEGGLRVSKTVTGKNADETKAFPFTVKLDGFVPDGTYGNMTFTNGKSEFSLRHGENRTALGLPAGITYTVIEEEHDGYQSLSRGETGTIQDEIIQEATFVNLREGNENENNGGSSGGGGGNHSGGGGGSHSGGGGSSHSGGKNPTGPAAQEKPKLPPTENQQSAASPHPEINYLPVMGLYGPSLEEQAAGQQTAQQQDSRQVIDLLAAQHSQNPDLAGWLTVPGTGNGYPVMYTPGNWEYYLHHNFQKQQDRAGIPFLGEGCVIGGDNTLIHGHNMNGVLQFGYFWNYTSPDFCSQNPTIDFKTIYDGNGAYEVMAVFFAPVYPAEAEGVFKWYQYVGELNEAQLSYYVEQAKAASLYDTGVTAEYGDKLITLETCSDNHSSNRLVVVARKKAQLQTN